MSLALVQSPRPAASDLLEHRIYLIRGQRVMLDRDLAGLYGVKAIALRQQLKRNRDRFPKDFVFQLNKKEIALLLSQNVIPSARELGGSKPYAFTEQGVAMLSSVLTSRTAVQVNIAIMRAFVRMREIRIEHADLLHRIQEMELRYDGQFDEVFEAIRALTVPPDPPRRPIGFVPADS
jgi:phage regulator Rha-like protein